MLGFKENANKGLYESHTEIEFIKASKLKVTSVTNITNQDLAVIQRHTHGGEKYLHAFGVEIKDEDDDLVARIRNIIYVRSKKRTR